MHFSLRGTVALIGAGALTIPLTGLAASQAATGGTYVLPGTHPGWATPSRAVGSPASTLRVTFQVNLRYRHERAAERRAMAVATPTSPLFHRYLSSHQFNARFAPTAQGVATVEAFLKDQGFTVVGVPGNHRWVSARGTVSQVESAFHTVLRTYSYHGEQLISPQSAISLPDGLRPLVLTVTGLDQSSLLVHPDNLSRQPSRVQPEGGALPPAAKCSRYWDQHEQQVPPAYGGRSSYPTYICGYHPDQFLSSYGLKQSVVKGHDGSGTKVAILDAYASPTIEQDANKYPGVPAFQKGQFSEKDFTPFTRQDKCGDWSTEESIDVESVHGMANGADVLYVGAKNCGPGLTQAMNWVVNNFDKSGSLADGVSIVSNSYGYSGENLSANLIRQQHAIAVQAANEGVGLYFSSGDNGDSAALNGGTPQPDYEASDPLVTAVGGTSLAVNAAGGYAFETGWGSTLDFVKVKNGEEKGYKDPLPGEFYAGAGGGTSTLFNEPGYQRGIVPPGLARAYDGTPNRVVPDVAMDADPYTGMLILQTVDGQLTKSTWGGTSLACPLFAGLQAIVQGRSKTAIGFANPTLYALKRSAYRDIVGPRAPEGVTNPSGSYLVTLDRDTSLQTTYGFDNVTGRGTPNGSVFVRAEQNSLSGCRLAHSNGC